jgi:hypothetical protein
MYKENKTQKEGGSTREVQENEKTKIRNEAQLKRKE